VKKEAELKYPHSANLFKFCRRVLDHKYGGIRVIDQDVGQILGFDPADCSHWKKGKKNIRSIQAMKSIAGHLGVDKNLVVDVASGEISDVEAYWEFTGYGSFKIDHKILEAAKKEYYRKHSGSWSRTKEQEFKDFFQINTNLIRKKVVEIHQTIGYLEAPLYLPEIVSHYPEVQLKPVNQWKDAQAGSPVHYYQEGSKFVISYKTGLELKPYMRFRIAKSMAAHFLPRRPQQPSNLKSFEKHIADIEGNIFASHLLAPVALIRQEFKQIDTSKDLIIQLSEAFWVSRSFINQRIAEIMLGELSDSAGI